MWACMRARAGQPRPSYKGALLWVSVERTRAEREMAGRCTRAIKKIRSLLVLTTEQAQQADFVDAEYRRAICQWGTVAGVWEVRTEEVPRLCTAGILTAQPSELASLLNTV